MDKKIYCVSPAVFEGHPNNYLIEKLLKFSEKDKTRYEVTSTQKYPIKTNGNKYHTMFEDSFLERDNFVEFRFNYNNDSHANLLVSDSNIIILDSIYSVYGDINFDTIQKEVTNFINDIIIKIRMDCELKNDMKSFYFKWINRTLECNKEYLRANEKTIMSQWLFCEEPILNKLCTHKYFFSWGNNIICNDIDDNLLKNILDSIIIMQYYYTLLDNANNDLREIINEISYSGRTENSRNLHRNEIAKKEFEHKKSKLSEIKNLVSGSIIKFNDDVISLQSYKKYFSKKIMVVWEFDELLISIEKKLVFCENILLDLENKIMKRSIFATDLILFLIGLSGVLSFTLYLGEFLDYQANHEISGFYNILTNIPTVMSSFLTNSFTGVLNLISFLILLLLLVSYINYKRK